MVPEKKKKSFFLSLSLLTFFHPQKICDRCQERESVRNHEMLIGMAIRGEGTEHRNQRVPVKEL